jgi:predicted membrane metal-binding protein
MAIVSGLSVRLLGRLLRARFAIPLVMLAVAGYTLLTGASPSVVHAAVMVGTGMFGRRCCYSHRPILLIRALLYGPDGDEN